MNATKSLLLAELFLCSCNASAQPPDKDPLAIVELGGAASWDLKGGGWSFGPDLAVEVTPIEKWLELEAGTTPLFRRHSTEWDTDLLFKKLSPAVHLFPITRVLFSKGLSHFAEAPQRDGGCFPSFRCSDRR